MARPQCDTPLVPSVPIWTKEQTHDFFLAYIFFFDPHKLFYFVHKIWILWEQKQGAFLQEILHSYHLQDIIHMWRWWIPCYQLKCTIIGHFQKRPMNLNLNHGWGSPHLLISPLGLWVIYVMWITFYGWFFFFEEKANNKFNYQQTTLVKKPQHLEKLPKKWLRKNDLFYYCV
jgi:hypothetical protein